VLGHDRVPGVFDDAGTGNACVERAGGVDDHVADAAHGNGGVARDETLGAVRACARNRHLLFLDAPGELRIERPRAIHAQRRGAKIVDRKRRSARRVDVHCRCRKLRHIDLHVPRQHDGVECAKVHGQMGGQRRAPAQQAVPPAAPVARTDDEPAIGDFRNDAGATGGFDVDRLGLSLQQRHRRIAADLDLVERREITMFETRGRLAADAARERPPGERRRDDDRCEDQPGERRAGHRRAFGRGLDVPTR